MGWSTIPKIIKIAKKKPKKITSEKADPRYYLKEPKTKIKNVVEKEVNKAVTQATSGVNIKFTKSGKPFVPLSEGTKSGAKKVLTKATGWAKLGGPGVGVGAATSDPVKEAKKKKKEKE